MKFRHRYSTHSDRSRRAMEADFAGLESSVEAGKRIKIGWRLLQEAARECVSPSPEWHHISVRGEPAAEVDYRWPEDWETALPAARVLCTESRGLTRPQREALARRVLDVIPGLTRRCDLSDSIEEVQFLDGDGFIAVIIDRWHGVSAFGKYRNELVAIRGK